MSERRTRRWHECLSSIKVPYDAPTPEMEKRFSEGRKAHYQIEARMRNIRDEVARTYSDPSLPFDIVFHADLYDEKNSIVYDVKPSVWMSNNWNYCVSQLAGYKYFLGARAAGFQLYELNDGKINGPWPMLIPNELLPTWKSLREIALKSDELLLEQKAPTQ